MTHSGKVRFSLLAVLLALVIFALAPAASAQQGGLLPLTEPTSDFNAIRGHAQQAGSVRVIVGLNTNSAFTAPSAVVTDAQRTAEVQRVQAQLLSSLSGANINSVKQFQYVPYIGMEVDAAALDQLQASPLVTSIELDSLSAPTMNTSTTQIGVAGAGGAWSYGYTGTGYVVAVFDTGVEKTHPALTGQVVAEACFSTNSADSFSACPGGASSSTAPNSGLPCDLAYVGCDHGTHVAGTVASINSTYKGVAPDAKIIAVQVFSEFPTYCGYACALSWNTDQIAALEHVYSLRNTYNIASINMSLGGGNYASTCDGDSRKTVIDLLRAANIATVIASGNSGYTNAAGAPGCISTAITVGSVTKADVISSFSNSASYVDMLAPGSAITSSVPGGGYDTWNGTSMATPHVAGAWAVLRDASPNATVDMIEAALESTGLLIADTRTNGVHTKPRIRVNLALDQLPPEAPTNLAAALNGSNDVNLSWSNVNFETGYTVQWSANGSTGWTALTTTGANVTSTTDTAIGCNETRYYRVYASNAGGNSGYSNVTNITANQCAPSAPTNLVASANGKTQINLSWSNVANETGYSIQWSANGSTGWTALTTTGTNVTSTSDNSVTCGTTRYYRVYATNSYGTSAASNVANATTVVCEPATPTNLVATANSKTQIALTWNDVATETGYTVEWSANGSSGWTVLGTTGANITSAFNTSLSCGTTRYYRVFASNAGGNSGYSNIANATTVVCEPSAPTNLVAAANGATQINLTWNDVASETGYTVEWSANGSTGWAALTTTGANITSTSDTSLSCETTRYYRVYASNAGGNSGYSSIANATTDACVESPPSTPTNLVATANGETQIDLTWNDVASETGYTVEWSANGSTGWAVLGTTGANVTSTSDTSLSCETTRYYRVYASNAGGNSGYSSIANATTDNCPVSVLNLVTNGGMELDENLDKMPDGWIVLNSIGDRIRCDTDIKTFSHTGECAFRFKGGEFEKTVLKQSIAPEDYAVLQSGDTLTFEAWVRAQNASTAGIIKVRIRYNDGTLTSKLNLPLAQTASWSAFGGTINVASSDIKNVRVTVRNRSVAGAIFIDDVSLKLQNGALGTTVPDSNTLPLPDAPDAFKR